MSIAEKLTTIAENQQKVYDAGYSAGQAAGGGGSGGVDYWQYVTNLNSTFKSVTFPDNTEVVLNVPLVIDIQYLIYGAKGVTKVVLQGNTANTAITGIYTFSCGTVTEIDLSNFGNGGIKFASAIKYPFMDCTRLMYIRGEIDLSNVTSSGNAANMFRSCGQLREVRFKAGSIKVDLAIPSTNLTADSIQSIIDGLADLTGATQQTLDLDATVVAKLTDAQKAAASAKNWVIA